MARILVLRAEPAFREQVSLYDVSVPATIAFCTAAELLAVPGSLWIGQPGPLYPPGIRVGPHVTMRVAIVQVRTGLPRRSWLVAVQPLPGGPSRSSRRNP